MGPKEDSSKGKKRSAALDTSEAAPPKRQAIVQKADENRLEERNVPNIPSDPCSWKDDATASSSPSASTVPASVPQAQEEDPLGSQPITNFLRNESGDGGEPFIAVTYRRDEGPGPHHDPKDFVYPGDPQLISWLTKGLHIKMLPSCPPGDNGPRNAHKAQVNKLSASAKNSSSRPRSATSLEVRRAKPAKSGDLAEVEDRFFIRFASDDQEWISMVTLLPKECWDSDRSNHLIAKHEAIHGVVPRIEHAQAMLSKLAAQHDRYVAEASRHDDKKDGTSTAIYYTEPYKPQDYSIPFETTQSSGARTEYGKHVSELPPWVCCFLGRWLNSIQIIVGRELDDVLEQKGLLARQWTWEERLLMEQKDQIELPPYTEQVYLDLAFRTFGDTMVTNGGEYGIKWVDEPLKPESRVNLLGGEDDNVGKNNIDAPLDTCQGSVHPEDREITAPPVSNTPINDHESIDMVQQQISYKNRCIRSLKAFVGSCEPARLAEFRAVVEKDHSFEREWGKVYQQHYSRDEQKFDLPYDFLWDNANIFFLDYFEYTKISDFVPPREQVLCDAFVEHIKKYTHPPEEQPWLNQRPSNFLEDYLRDHEIRLKEKAQMQDDAEEECSLRDNIELPFVSPNDPQRMKMMELPAVPRR
ncbi:uncharacterized protein I303_105142 [Kwoniella dejecticola CBS 10117]|uniref:Uncharacterized protein n=1 Tax=Kwoniella dejecticola CBS 10117 TaxID=1296121 RepID=A0A1A6A3C8_9TREE|nr:uncharacterized protein I303_05413 [Kwoniella dejecticola CBS 10117]OBR84554.1 hypothetical protein I303_05413 [Kwoniella dejecticola CBS 10117]